MNSTAHLAPGVWGGTQPFTHCSMSSGSRGSIMQRTQEAVKERGSQLVPRGSQEQPGQYRKPWGTSNCSLPTLRRCDGHTIHPQCWMSPSPKPPNTGVFYIPTPPVLAPPAQSAGKAFSPFCLLGGSCSTQACCQQCPLGTFSSGACTAHPQLVGRSGAGSAPHPKAAAWGNSVTSLKSTQLAAAVRQNPRY